MLHSSVSFSSLNYRAAFSDHKEEENRPAAAVGADHAHHPTLWTLATAAGGTMEAETEVAR